MIQCPSSSLIVFGSKSNLSDIRIATPPFFWCLLTWYIVFYPFTLNLEVSLGLKWVFCRQHMDGSCFFIHSDTLCLLIGAFSPFTFRVTTERYEFSASALPVKSISVECLSLSGLCYFSSFSLPRGLLSIFIIGLVWWWQILCFYLSWKFFISPFWMTS